MVNWYYYDNNGQKQGPIREQVLVALAKNGTITPDTLIENEDGKQGKAGKVKGLTFPESATPKSTIVPPVEPNPFTDAHPVADNPLTEPATPIFDFVNKVIVNAKITASTMAKQVAIKKLQSIGLRTAFLKLGNAVFARQFGKDKFAVLYQVINTVNERMSARLNGEAKPGETLAERSALLMTNAKTKVMHEKDTLERNQKFVELGKAAFESGLGSEFTEEQEGIRKIQSDISKLQRECEELRFADNFGFHMKLLAAAGMLFLLCVGYFVFSGVLSNGSGGGNNDTMEVAASNGKDVMEGAMRLFNDVYIPEAAPRYQFLNDGTDGASRLTEFIEAVKTQSKENIKRLRTIGTRGCPDDFRKAFEKRREIAIKSLETIARIRYNTMNEYDRGFNFIVFEAKKDKTLSEWNKLGEEYPKLCHELETICKKYNLHTMPSEQNRPVQQAEASAPE